MQKIVFSLLAVMIALSLAMTGVWAQDAVTAAGDDEPVMTGEANFDEAMEVAAEELEVAEPGAFSWFSNAIRNVRIVITRDPVKKSELELKKANFELLRARKMAQQNPDDPGLQDKLEKIDEKYEDLIEGINVRIEKFKADNPEAPKLINFLDKYTSQQLKHQEILKNLEEKVPEQVMEKIKANRERHLEKFGEVMNKLQTKEELKERLRKAVEVGALMAEGVKVRVEDRVERRANRAEILEELQEKAPEIKTGIQEIKQERVQLFQELKVKREEIRQNRQEFRQGVKQELQENKDELETNPETRQELRQEVREERQDMRQENQAIRKEIGEERQGFREKVKEWVKELKENEGSENNSNPASQPNLEGNPLPPLPEGQSGNEPG